MVLAMTSDALPLSQIYNLADQIIGQRISEVEGVSQVVIGGGAKSAVRVQMNPVALASMGLSLEEILVLRFRKRMFFRQRVRLTGAAAFCYRQQRPTDACRSVFADHCSAA